MRRLAWIMVILVSGSAPSWAQFPEVDALLETFFAKDLPTILKHLPPQIQKAVSELPADRQAQIVLMFPNAEKLKREGGNVTRSDDPQVLVVSERKSGETSEAVEILLDKRISDGNECVLRLKARQRDSKAAETGMVRIWMRFEDGEWRIYELDAGEPESIDLNDPAFLDRVAGAGASGSKAANEASAVGTLRTYNTAFVTYAAAYEDLGFPASLDLLGMEEGTPTAVSSRHAGLVDQPHTTPPYEVSGYRFTYQPATSSTPISAYTIVARPLEYGNTGTRSFFTDESGVIRFTSEDREPTRADPPLH